MELVLILLAVLLVSRSSFSLLDLLIIILLISMLFGGITVGNHGVSFTGHGIDWR